MKEGFMAQALARRVPQILGLYVAATWMTIEIGEWVSPRLGLPPDLTLWIFAAMAIMAPSVAVVAWFHGAPGADRWVTFEKIFVPLNVVAAAALVSSMVQNPSQEPTVAATETDVNVATEARAVTDETGATVTYEVPRSGFHRRAYGSFWKTNGEADWISYAIPWLLTHDINREPLLTLRTPYEEGHRDEYAKAGFERAVGEPLALTLSLAREEGAQLAVVGEHQLDQGQHTLVARVYDATTGEQLDEVTTSDADLITATSRIANLLTDAMAGDVRRAGVEIADISLAEAVTANEAALKRMIEAINAWFFDNDYATALTMMEEVVAMDPAFAVAHDWRHQLYRLTGDLDSAKKAVDAALALDYKLDSESRFLLKANRYAIEGQVEQAIRVLEVWSEVRPDSFQVFELLARNYQVVARLDDSRAALERAFELNPNATEIYRRLANVERMRGEPLAAAELLERYLGDQPEDADARLTLAESYLQAGQFDDARRHFEEASFMASRDFEAGIGIAQTLSREGRFEEAMARIMRLSRTDLSAGQEVELALTQVRLFSSQGKIRSALAVFDDLSPSVARALPPLQQLLIVGSYRAGLLASLGDFDAALAQLDQMQSSLQPPMNGFADLGRISVYEIAKDREGLTAAVNRLEAFYQTFTVPLLMPFITAAQARLALWDGRPEDAVEKFQTAIATMQQSIAGLDLAVMDYQYVGLSKAIFETGDLERAETMLRDRLDKSPALASARVELARVLAARGADAAAREALEQALSQWNEADEDFAERLRALELKAQFEQQQLAGEAS